MSDINIYFVLSNLFFIGMYLHQWEKNRVREIRDEIKQEEKEATPDATTKEETKQRILRLELRDVPLKRKGAVKAPEIEGDVIIMHPEKFRELPYEKTLSLEELYEKRK